MNLNKVSELTGYKHFYVYQAESGCYVPFVYSQSSNPVTPSQYIHPHQAFFVLKEAGEAENFTFTYDMATTQHEENSYFRDDHVNYPLVNLFVDNERGQRDLAIVELNRPELGGAVKTSALRSSNFRISAYFDGRDYGMLFTPKGAERVPVHFKTGEDGTYTMTWDTYNGDFTSLILVDNLTGARCDMLLNDHYTFKSSVSDYAARFYITFVCTDINEYSEAVEDFAWFNGNEWVINGTGTLQVIDVLGRQLLSKELISLTSNLSSLTSPGVYLLRLIDGNKVKTQKIVVR